MERLLTELCDSGVLDVSAVEWVRREKAESGGAIDAILLELDLIGEDALWQGLIACQDLPVAPPSAVSLADSRLSQRFPLNFSTSFQMCPFMLLDGELTVLVEARLPKESSDELREVFSLEIRQVVATSHQLALVRAGVYGIAVDDRVRALEEKLARRRQAQPISAALDEMTQTQSLSEATHVLLEYCSHWVDFACLLVVRDEQLRIAATRGEGAASGLTLAFPGADCSLAAALRHGGYFFGPVGQSGDDADFFRALGREVPRWAAVAPVPVTGASKVMFYADNGARGVATRRAAELALLVSRLGQRRQEPAARSSTETTMTSTEAASDQAAAAGGSADATDDVPPEVASVSIAIASDPGVAVAVAAAEVAVAAAVEVAVAVTAPEVSETERTVLSKLRQAATTANLSLDVFVDGLLRQHALTVPKATDAALVGDIRGLLERLATDIPTQLVRGMETAFREMVPRLAAPLPTSEVAVPTSAPAPVPASAKAPVGIVMKEAKPREVPSYKSRRKKARKLKL